MAGSGVLLIAGLGLAPAAASAQDKSAPVKLGVVVPKNLVRGERASGAVVLNPDDYLSVPGLKVTATQFDRPVGSGAPALSNFQVQVNAAPLQLANVPFSFIAGDKLDVRIKPTGAPDSQAVQLNIPLAPGNNLVLPRDFTTSPISQFGSLAVIHGPFGGDGRQTFIDINGHSASVIAESQRSLFYLLPEVVTPGAAQIDLKDGNHHSRLKTWVLGLQMSADRLQLKRGESTAFHVVITGAETIPPEAWSGAGAIAELMDVDTIRKFEPNFQPPVPSSPGFLLLTVENVS